MTRNWQKANKKWSNKLPLISVVVPAFNEATTLSACLQSLVDQDYQGKYEIIVVNNNSTDLTAKIAAIYSHKVISEKRQGVAWARQAGFKAAKGEIIFSTDADTIVPQNWISTIVSEFIKKPKLIAFGGGISYFGSNTLFKLFFKAYQPINNLISMMFNLNFRCVNMAVRKDAFLQVGGFDTSLEQNEDRRLKEKLKEIGYVMMINKAIVKTSARRLTLGIFYYFKYTVYNYFVYTFLHKTVKGVFGAGVREKPYVAYDTINDMPFFIITLILSLFIIVFIIGNIPGVDIWSVSHAKTSEKVIALTFDDGPSADFTPAILDILKEKQIKATFFILGTNAKLYPSETLRIFSEGHQIANHTYKHQSKLKTAIETPQNLISDIKAGNEVIFNIIGKYPKFFRPPYGYRTVWGARAVAKAGFITVTWNDMPNSWDTHVSSKKIIIDLIRKASPGGIIVLHDSAESPKYADKTNTVRALEEIIDLLSAEGYRFVTVSELLGQPAYDN